MPSTSRGSVRRLGPAGRAAVLVAVVAYWGVAGFAGWSLAWSDDPGAAFASGPPRLSGAVPVFPNELQPLFEEPIGGGAGSGPSIYRVGDDGHVALELLYVGQDLPDTVPPRPLAPLTDEQRHERDLAFAEGEEAHERWATEVGLNRPYVPLPRTPAFIDLEVGCYRMVVSGYDVPEPDAEGLQAVEALLEQRLQEVYAGSRERCQDVEGYDGG